MCSTRGVGEWVYAWLKRDVCDRDVENASLTRQIVAIWRKFRKIYGAPRIWIELGKMGIEVSLNRVAKLMRQAGIRGKTARKYRPQTTQSDPSHAVAPNLLNRNFKEHQRHAVWLTDITYINT